MREKKELADHEVHKATGVFTKINNLLQTLTLVKSAVVAGYSIYHFFIDHESNCYFTILCALVMSFILLKKYKLTGKAIEDKKLMSAKRMFKRAITLAALFGLFYLFWSVSMVNSVKAQTKPQSVDPEFVQRGMARMSHVRGSQLPDMKHVRIGRPGAHQPFDGERANSNKYPQLTKEFLKVEEAKIREEYLYEQKVRKEYNHIFEFPAELPMIIAFTALASFFVVKFAVYFMHFLTFKRALEKQEQVDSLILHFQNVRIIQASQRIEEIKQSVETITPTPAVSDEPVIEEEPMMVPTKSNLPVDEMKIVEVTEETSYPVISAPKFPVKQSTTFIDMHGNVFTRKGYE